MFSNCSYRGEQEENTMEPVENFDERYERLMALWLQDCEREDGLHPREPDPSYDPDLRFAELVDDMGDDLDEVEDYLNDAREMIDQELGLRCAAGSSSKAISAS
jgi:hypothetical protein